MRNEGALKQGGSSRGGEKSESGCILKTEKRGLPNWLHVGHERKELRLTLRVWVFATEKDAVCHPWSIETGSLWVEWFEERLEVPFGTW